MMSPRGISTVNKMSEALQICSLRNECKQKARIRGGKGVVNLWSHFVWLHDIWKVTLGLLKDQKRSEGVVSEVYRWSQDREMGPNGNGHPLAYVQSPCLIFWRCANPGTRQREPRSAHMPNIEGCNVTYSLLCFWCPQSCVLLLALSASIALLRRFGMSGLPIWGARQLEWVGVVFPRSLRFGQHASWTSFVTVERILWMKEKLRNYWRKSILQGIGCFF